MYLHTKFFEILVFIMWIWSTACNSSVVPVSITSDTITVNGKELVPEGIAVHPQTGIIYLSSLHLNKIVAVDSRGNYKDLISEGQDGFMKGIGIKISQDSKTLWACTASLDTVKSKSGLFQIDLRSGKVLDKVFFEDDSSSLFNDLAIQSNGVIYLTDTYQRTVFRYDPSTKNLEPWLQSDQFTYANGIAFSSDEAVLFVASGSRGVQRIDMQTKEITAVTKGVRTDYAIDGLVCRNRMLFGVIGWPQHPVANHRVIRYQLDENHYLKSVDTLLINQPQLKVPTTAAMFKDQLYVLTKTNLDWYNKANQSLQGVTDSLEFPQIVKIRL